MELARGLNTNQKAKARTKATDKSVRATHKIKTGALILSNPARPGSPPPELLNCNVGLARESENGTRVLISAHQSASVQMTDYKAENLIWKDGAHSESTMPPGVVPVEKGELTIALGTPVDGSYV